MNLTKVLIPPVESLDSNYSNLDPQQVTSVNPNTGYLNIDSNLAVEGLQNANSMIITTPNRNIFINKIRRIAVKDFDLFYYLDNIVTGYNDEFQIIFKTQLPSTPITEVINVIIPQGVYTTEELGVELQSLLDAWIVANWGSVPLPTITVTYTPSGGLYGRLIITGVYDGVNALIAIDPYCSFIANSGGMIALTRSNNFALPTTEELKLSFVSETQYRYIDIISKELTKDIKVTNTNNVVSNYRAIHRLILPKMGWNREVLVEPLQWINVNLDTNISMIDLQFLGPDGVPLRGAIGRDFNFLMTIVMQR